MQSADALTGTVKRVWHKPAGGFWPWSSLAAGAQVLSDPHPAESSPHGAGQPGLAAWHKHTVAVTSMQPDKRTLLSNQLQVHRSKGIADCRRHASEVTADSGMAGEKECIGVLASTL